MSGPDVLAAGASRRTVSTPVRALLVTLLVLLGVADAQARRLEVDALLDRARAGQSTVAFADRRLAATVEYASPQLASPTAPAAVRADLQALVRREAAGQLPALLRRRDQAERSPVLPWHRTTRQARAAYVRHLDARVARLTAVSTDLAALYVRRPGLDQRLQAARDALTAAAGTERAGDALDG